MLVDAGADEVRPLQVGGGLHRVAVAGIQLRKTDVARQVGDLDFCNDLRREALRRIIGQMDDLRRKSARLRRGLQIGAELRHQPFDNNMPFVITSPLDCSLFDQLLSRLNRASSFLFVIVVIEVVA